jgi:restriction endonuclease S subunit
MRVALVEWTRIVGTHFLPKRYIDPITIMPAVQLGDICDIASGVYADAYAPKTSCGGLPYLRVNNVREFVPNLTPCDVEHVIPKDDWGARVCVAVGDVLIARTGTLGRAFVAPRRLDGAVMSQHVTRLRLREYSTVRAQLLAAYLNSPQGKAQVMAVASGSTRLELTHDDINRIRIPRNALSGALATEVADGVARDFEDAIGGALAAFEACNALTPPAGAAEQFFSAPYDDAAFIGSLAPRFHRPSRANLEAALASEFECVPLGRIALVKRGAGSLAAEYESGGIPYIRTSSIVNYGIELFPEHYGTEETYRAHRQNVGPGDILLTMEGKIGALALLGEQERCLIKNHVEFIRLHRASPVPAEFVYAFLSSHIGQTQIERRTVVQTTIPGLGSESRSLLVPIAGRTAKSKAQLRSAVAAATKAVQRSQCARSRLRSRLHALVRAVGQDRGDELPDACDASRQPDSRATSS